MKCFEHLVRDFITSSLPASIDPLQFAYHYNCSTGNAIAHLLHTTLTLMDKGRAPQGCGLSLLLYSLYTYDCVATSSSTVIVKFAEDTVVMGLISDNDERAYLEEIKDLENRCQENNLFLNISKTKELIVDCCKKQERHYQPVRISGTTMERVDSSGILEFTSPRHINSLAKKVRQRLYHLRRRRDFRLPSKMLRNLYTCTIESILTGNITVWFGNCTKQDRQALQTVVRSAERITHTELPDLQTIYYKWCQTKARRIKTTEKEKADSMEVFSSLVRCIERSQAELLQVLEEKQEAAEWQAEEFIKELQQEITELKRRDTELEQLSHTEDHIHLLQMYPSLCSPPHTKDWTDITINTPLSVETLRRALSQLQETLRNEMEKLPEIMDVTLDSNTAHPHLFLSADGKQVRHGDTPQNLPDNPERFNLYTDVLGKEGFSSGRFYYEVQVRGNTEWDLGVVRESINRNADITASPKNGFWAVWLRNETEYAAMDSPSVSLSLKQAPKKVGVFVDYEEGLVSFYDVEARSHIYSFTGQSFTEKLYPYFSPCLSDGGKNSAPLIICPVNDLRSQSTKYWTPPQTRRTSKRRLTVYAGALSTMRRPGGSEGPTKHNRGLRWQFRQCNEVAGLGEPVDDHQNQCCPLMGAAP
ncbi:hypothetical protein P4O66_008791 [Electrophorus voltai]|uniref:B30.2/SPRY domain-containing protein n=1 Tax=Electrophorus voltai TaxID=2609070 RepID=A0AAD8ZE76_9TELE|nr:hypothetical protein P4O66_008791 [Electrophorus voltai]